MKATPCRNYVWIGEEKEVVSKGGIHLPEKREKELTQVGMVVAVGPGQLHPETGMLVRPCVCKVGDKVSFIAYGANRFDYDGEKFLIVEDTQITSILT